MPPRPFPAMSGGCYCTATRYRLLTSPLFCYACHCPSCQKSTGSAFALILSIETYNLTVLSATKPSLVTITPDRANPSDTARRALCPKCGTLLWGHDNPWGYAVADVRIGTLDFPGLMEPDVHSFVGSKVGWIGLPAGARTAEGHYEYAKVWPKSSLKRLEVCLQKFEAAKRGVGGQGAGGQSVEAAARRNAQDSSSDPDGEKTPTATAGEEGEDEEAFEKRFKETEAKLQERLAKLSLKVGAGEAGVGGGEGGKEVEVEEGQEEEGQTKEEDQEKNVKSTTT